jgi:hypothetical protein
VKLIILLVSYDQPLGIAYKGGNIKFFYEMI